jgi:hypothetical protein
MCDITTCHKYVLLSLVDFSKYVGLYGLDFSKYVGQYGLHWHSLMKR